MRGKSYLEKELLLFLIISARAMGQTSKALVTSLGGEGVEYNKTGRCLFCKDLHNLFRLNRKKIAFQHTLFRNFWSIIIIPRSGI